MISQEQYSSWWQGFIIGGIVVGSVFGLLVRYLAQ